MQPVLCVVNMDRRLVISMFVGTLSLDSLQQWRAHNRVWTLYCICCGLVAISPDHLEPTAVATRRHETHYIQIQCNSRHLLPSIWQFQIGTFKDQPDLMMHQIFISMDCMILFWLMLYAGWSRPAYNPSGLCITTLVIHRTVLQIVKNCEMHYMQDHPVYNPSGYMQDRPVIYSEEHQTVL